jgi:hypothetical protein
MTDKNPASFRLSDQAIDALENIERITGMNKTAIVEMALAYLLKMLMGQNSKTNWCPLIAGKIVPTNHKGYLLIKVSEE